MLRRFPVGREIKRKGRKRKTFAFIMWRGKSMKAV